MEILGESNIAELTEKFDNAHKIIKLYKKTVGNLNEIPEAGQYQESMSWLNQLSEVITNHIQSFELDQSENINILENSINSLRKFSDLFKGGELTKPIIEISEFHDLLNKSGFDLPTKVEIKKAIGQANYKVVMNKKDIKNTDELDKYKLIYEKKSALYVHELSIIKKTIKEKDIILNIENALEQIYNLSDITGLDFKKIQNAVVCILLKEYIELYDKDNQMNIISDLENIILISRKQNTKEIIEEQEDLVIIQATNLLKQGNEIVQNESELIKNDINKNVDYYKLALTDKVEENELTLSIIVDSIKQNLEILKNIMEDYKNHPNIYEKKCKELILNLTDYIETYNIIKKRLKEAIVTNKSSKYEIIYLTNANNELITLDYLNNDFTEEEKSKVNNILNKILNGEQIEFEKENIKNYKILNVVMENITISLMLLKNNAVLILGIFNTYNKEILNNIIKNLSTKINNIINKANSIKDLKVLLDEQEVIRNQINSYLNINMKTK